jgi:hypothetical protein
LLRIVGKYSGDDNLKSCLDERSLKFRTGEVLAHAAMAGVADG